MAVSEPQRIHPSEDMEAPATVPLVPPLSATSQKTADPIHQQHQRLHPPVLQQNQDIPRPKRKRNCLCRCLCCIVCLLILLIILLGTALAVLYFVFKPKIPDYSIDRLSITDLRLNLDLSLYAQFNVRITAYNPNKKISIYYEKGGVISVWYPTTNTKLCQGSLPKFFQGYMNKTRLNVALSGQNQYGSALMSALQQQQQMGRVPLEVKVRAPVSVKLGSVKLRKVNVLGKCALVVDSLTANNLVSIKMSSCKFGLKL